MPALSRFVQKESDRCGVNTGIIIGRLDLKGAVVIIERFAQITFVRRICLPLILVSSPEDAECFPIWGSCPAERYQHFLGAIGRAHLSEGQSHALLEP